MGGIRQVGLCEWVELGELGKLSVGMGGISQQSLQEWVELGRINQPVCVGEGEYWSS